jgi:hypothetical protein
VPPGLDEGEALRHPQRLGGAHGADSSRRAAQAGVLGPVAGDAHRECTGTFPSPAVPIVLGTGRV